MTLHPHDRRVNVRVNVKRTKKLNNIIKESNFLNKLFYF